MCGLAAATVILATSVAWAQRVQFPSMVQGGYGAAPTMPVQYAPPPTTFGGTAPPFGTPPAYNAPTYTPPGYTPPAYNVPTTPPPGYGGAPVYPQSPATSFGSGVQPVNPSWDPYAGTSPPPSAFAQPYYQAPPSLEPPPDPNAGFFAPLQQPMRLLQNVGIRGTWLYSNGDADSFGMTDVEATATFAFPMGVNQAPLLITPGFAFHFLDGPLTQASTGNAQLPPRVYDAYLDVAWNPQFSPWFGMILGGRVGVYSDFETFTTESLRTMGRVLGVITFNPQWQLAFGVIYLDRLEVKLLPAGGLIWQPNPDNRFDILFPNPKFAHRMSTVGTTDWWIYLAGEYGGGSWTFERTDGTSDQFDYNDIRLMVGIESFGASGAHWMFEAGWVTDRQIVYRSELPPNFDPSDTFMLRSGITW